MNKLDRPNDKEIAKVLEDKAERISRVVAKPRAGGGGRPASLLVIQEAPGPQLRALRGAEAMIIAKERVFTQTLRDKLPPHIQMYEEVELNNRDNDQKKEMGEDHTFFWDPAILTLVEGPQPLNGAVMASVLSATKLKETITTTRTATSIATGMGSLAHCRGLGLWWSRSGGTVIVVSVHG
jgi:hypothetical protein